MNHSPRQMLYAINVDNLRKAMIAIHLNHLHQTQLDMIDEAVLKSDMSESKTVIKHIMEK
jgi:UDP-N-acetylglucosamine pyrophosphorylase